jgi:hypothetical protein
MDHVDLNTADSAGLSVGMPTARRRKVFARRMRGAQSPQVVDRARTSALRAAPARGHCVVSKESIRCGTIWAHMSDD